MSVFFATFLPLILEGPALSFTVPGEGLYYGLLLVEITYYCLKVRLSMFIIVKLRE